MTDFAHRPVLVARFYRPLAGKYFISARGELLSVKSYPFRIDRPLCPVCKTSKHQLYNAMTDNYSNYYHVCSQCENIIFTNYYVEPYLND
jgi:hypothetical protein